jgi:hypothetical protein
LTLLVFPKATMMFAVFLGWVRAVRTCRCLP